MDSILTIRISRICGREGGVCSGKTCMRPRVSSILGFPEEKLKREVEKEEDSVCSSSETTLLELHIGTLLNSNMIMFISSTSPQL
uniref:Uncharacterized protein n=1 Tax=Medicago truncatula TaxID=3880 RepID=I3ST61_MEDTR|nr:unknown [Medicago truncatula]